MHITELEETQVREIGHAFGYYAYGAETGMGSFFKTKDAVAEYICGYVRCVLAAGMLYTTSARGEGYIAYKLPGQKIPAGAAMQLLKGVFRSMSLGEVFRFARVLTKGGASLEDRLKKAKKPCVFVGMVCVREAYQGQGYMRKVMEMAFAEGARLGVPVVLETDAMSKCEKYQHLGMQLENTRDLGAYGKMYDLIWYPETQKQP